MSIPSHCLSTLTYGETHEDDVCVGVGERPESVVVLLTGGIPQRQLDLQNGMVRVSGGVSIDSILSG